MLTDIPEVTAIILIKTTKLEIFSTCKEKSRNCVQHQYNCKKGHFIIFVIICLKVTSYLYFSHKNLSGNTWSVDAMMA